MGSDIKNGKERTIYIYMFRLIHVLFLSVLITCWIPLKAYEKTWVIVIDAGHGGKDPGALGLVSREKEINLAIALKTGEYLEHYMKNIKVLYTRKSDVFVGLRERAEFANRNKADLFISIHANWAGAKSIKGAETYIMGISKDEQNLEVAMKENEVILLEEDFSTKYEGFDPKSPESYIIFSLMQNVFKDQSTDFASRIQEQFKNRARRIDRGVKQDGFWVLYMTSMPSVLIETGFITNPEEEKYLISKEGQEYIASAIFRASRDYINTVDKRSHISTSMEADQITLEGSSPAEIPPPADELSFMIQITTSAERKELKPENFRGIKEVFELYSNDYFKYATGKFISYAEAVEYRKKIESVYPDAFVIAVKENKILPLQDALNLQQNK